MIYCNLHPFFHNAQSIGFLKELELTNLHSLLQSNMVVFWSIHYQRNSNFQRFSWT